MNKSRIGFAMKLCIGGGALVLCLVVQAAMAVEPATKRLLLLGQGPDGHPPATHEYFAGHKILAHCLTRVPGIEVQTIDAAEPWTAGPELLTKADGVVIFLAEGAAWVARDPRRYEALTALATRGGAFSALHWGIGTKKAENIEPFQQLLGACHGGPDRKYRIVEVPATPALPRHVIATKVEPFTTRDEWYYRLKFVAPASAIAPVLQVTIDDEPQTVAWAWERADGGRSFGCSGLHFHENWRIPAYRRLIVQGVVWSMRLPIPDDGLAVDVPDQLLVLPAAAPR